MPDNVSERGARVLEAMKAAGITNEAKMTDADHITKLVKLPKGQVSEALHELAAKKLVKHVAHHKAARYYVLQTAPTTTT